jgi:hypothetical protein
MIPLHPELMWQLAAEHRRDLNRSATIRRRTATQWYELLMRLRRRRSLSTSTAGHLNISEPWRAPTRSPKPAPS